MCRIFSLVGVELIFGSLFYPTSYKIQSHSLETPIFHYVHEQLQYLHVLCTLQLVWPDDTLMECCFCNGEEPDPLEKWLLGQKAYESLLQAAVDSRTTLPDIFCSHPKNNQSLVQVDIVADTVNQSSHTNLSARKSDGDLQTTLLLL